MANHQDLAAQIIHNNQLDMRSIMIPKKRKREENLKNWKWNEVIEVDDLPDDDEPVPNTANVTDHTIIQHDVSDDEIPMAPIKKNKRSQIKITGKNRFKQLFHEDESQEDEIEDDGSEADGSQEDETEEDDDWV